MKLVNVQVIKDELAGFLPIESADMFYWCADHYPKENWIIEVGTL